MLEIKSSSTIVNVLKQMLNYLAALGCKLGLIVNFNEEKVNFKRVIL